MIRKKITGLAVDVGDFSNTKQNEMKQNHISSEAHCFVPSLLNMTVYYTASVDDHRYTHVYRCIYWLLLTLPLLLFSHISDWIVPSSPVLPQGICTCCCLCL